MFKRLRSSGHSAGAPFLHQGPPAGRTLILIGRVPIFPAAFENDCPLVELLTVLFCWKGWPSTEHTADVICSLWCCLRDCWGVRGQQQLRLAGAQQAPPAAGRTQLLSVRAYFSWAPVFDCTFCTDHYAWMLTGNKWNSSNSDYSDSDSLCDVRSHYTCSLVLFTKEHFHNL